MKTRVLVAAGLLVALSAPANAFFFFFLPIGAIQNAVQGGHCVPQSTKVGDRINLGGKNWVVKQTNGVSSRCSQYPNWPVIAKLEPYISETEATAETQVCVAMGTSQGSNTFVQGMGEVYVRSVSSSGTDCTDMRTPVSARVVRLSHANQPVVEQPKMAEPQRASAPGPELPKPVANELAARSPTLETPKLIPVEATQQPVASSKTTVEKLRELKQLRDENLLTESVYESRQKEILSNQ